MKLSIVIRCRNEAKSLAHVFDALRMQRCDFAYEIVIVDNESNDNTLELCRAQGARVVSITAAEFTYGKALNVGIREARGELILLLSAHALPVGCNFLQNAVAALEDPKIAAARCLMVGNPNQFAAWYKPKIIHYDTPEQQKSAESGAGWLGDYPTAGCCILRRSVWEQVPFDEEIEANEEKQWASKVLSLGYSILCCAEAVWIYTRKRSPAAERKKRIREHIALYRLNGQPPLGLAKFVLLSGRACCVAPWIAIRHVIDHIVWYGMLLTVPLKARKRPRSGSVREYSELR